MIAVGVPFYAASRNWCWHSISAMLINLWEEKKLLPFVLLALTPTNTHAHNLIDKSTKTTAQRWCNIEGPTYLIIRATGQLAACFLRKVSLATAKLIAISGAGKTMMVEGMKDYALVSAKFIQSQLITIIRTIPRTAFPDQFVFSPTLWQNYLNNNKVQQNILPVCMCASDYLLYADTQLWDVNVILPCYFTFCAWIVQGWRVVLFVWMYFFLLHRHCYVSLGWGL